MDSHIDARAQRAWRFFLDNAGALVLGALAVVLGFALVLPGPWLALNLLGEVADAVDHGRAVRWQACYERTGTFVPAWGLALTLGVTIGLGLALCVVPGVLLAIAWLHAPVLVARGTPVFDALRASYAQLHRVEDWVGTLLNGLVLVACALACSFTAVLTVVALPVALAYLAMCTLDTRVAPADLNRAPLDATA